MAFEFRFPDVGEGIVEGEVVRVLVQEGETIKLDQPLFEVETDKAVVTIPSPRAGRIEQIPVREGEVINVGQIIVVIAETEAPTRSEASSTVVGALEEAPAAEKVPPSSPRRERPKKERQVLAIPSVRKLATELEVDLTTIEGSGPSGRITREDVLRAAEAQKTPPQPVAPAAPEGVIEVVPLHRLRRTIAQAMVKSKFTAPHVTSTDEVDITLLSEIREKEKDTAQKQGIRLTFIPFLIKAVVAGLIQHPFLNASLDEEKEEILLKKYYNIGVATHTDEGLMVPVIKNVDKKSILHIAKEIDELSRKARERTIDFAELHGGTFTLTNYGSIGGIFGTPIIHYPEVAILGVGKLMEKPVVFQGTIAVRKILPLSLSFDHRVIDGVVAQQFLNTVMERLENPHRLLLEL